MQSRAASRGVSLIELIITIVVLAILVSIGVPQMRDFIEKRRVVGAAESVKDLILRARSEAIKQSSDIFVTVCADSENWLVGAADDDGAGECSDAASFTVSTATRDGSVEPVRMAVSAAGGSGNYPGVSLTSNGGGFAFTSRGVLSDPSDAPQITMSDGRWALRVEVNPLGRVKLCSGDDGINPGGYRAC